MAWPMHSHRSMQAIRGLEEEHRLIERVLDALEQYVGSEPADPESQRELLEFVDFIRGYADRLHHGKEEDILFQEMIRAGFPQQTGPLAVMLDEHERGRALTTKLHTLGSASASWSPAERALLQTAATGYAQLLRQHIFKEDSILYPMAEARLDRNALTRVEDACADFERKQEQSGEKQRLVSLGERLSERYPPRSPRGES